MDGILGKLRVSGVPQVDVRNQNLIVYVVGRSSSGDPPNFRFSPDIMNSSKNAGEKAIFFFAHASRRDASHTPVARRLGNVISADYSQSLRK